MGKWGTLGDTVQGGMRPAGCEFDILEIHGLGIMRMPTAPPGLAVPLEQHNP